ncbi:hypothetical protein BBD42_04380 [Paenibacillus sp. BIHB 4019]|uniref:Uncharacterized protein n=1 Tax=Paenibacillus sp. BIHB 4019 TaxID=1870819 RepID=A0A1B2DDJ4_9BACL|nr:hypothetical protein [Paenibacillus sp. BIHB 4019]ANY65787.1 hypothetical protein BBD42_04380 [Paenibacillus sp. BIHB 4019]
MGWEYGIKTTNPSILPELVARLADAIHVTEPYRIERYENGFALLQDDPSWPKILQVSIETAAGLEDMTDGEAYVYCLFHIRGELAAGWLKHMERETKAQRYAGRLEWFEL